MFAAQFFPDPAKPIIVLRLDEAKRLADALYKVADEYDLAKYFTGKTPAIVGLVIVAGTIYIPRYLQLSALSKAMLAAQNNGAGPFTVDANSLKKEDMQ